MFIANENNPKVSKMIGRKMSFNKGLIKKLIEVKIRATMISGYSSIGALNPRITIGAK